VPHPLGRKSWPSPSGIPMRRATFISIAPIPIWPTRRSSTGPFHGSWRPPGALRRAMRLMLRRGCICASTSSVTMPRASTPRLSRYLHRHAWRRSPSTWGWCARGGAGTLWCTGVRRVYLEIRREEWTIMGASYLMVPQLGDGKGRSTRIVSSCCSTRTSTSWPRYGFVVMR
jgi:hypothetical protein